MSYDNGDIDKTTFLIQLSFLFPVIVFIIILWVFS